jgi:hypothetical protein
MPVTVTVPVTNLTRVLDKLESPELIERLGASLSKQLADNSPVASGANKRAWQHIGTPTKIVGGWRIGVGDGEALGSPDDPAPRGTLRAFFDYLESQGAKPAYTDWRNMQPAHQDKLEELRRGGLFGGRGADYANYAWIQNAGNMKARVTATHFIDRSLAEWRSEVPAIVRSYFRE